MFVLTDIPIIVFIGLTLAIGVVIGMVFEHYRIMTRLEDAVDEADDIKPCCGNCLEYDGDHCMLCWNNAEKEYYVPERDDKDPYDCCDYWQLDKNALEDE